MIDLKPKSPVVSVVLPAYNSEAYVGEAIESILKQTYPHFELVLIDDGSSDGSWEILSRFANRDNRVRLYRNEKNMGIAATRNRALELSAGKYIAVMDNDDVSHPQRLEKQVAFLEKHPDCAVVGCQIALIDEQGKHTGSRSFPLGQQEIMGIIGRETPFAHSGVTMRRDALSAVGGYSGAYPGCEDYELWFKLAERFNLSNLPDTLLSYRRRKGQFSDVKVRETLGLSLAIQRRWMLRRKFFRLANLFHHALKYSLLFLPASVVSALFTRRLFRNG